MSQDPEKVKRLVAFKEKLSKEIEELEAELKDAQAMLETVNSILLEKGFKHPEITKEPVKKEEPQPKQEIPIEFEPVAEPAPLAENVLTLKTGSGEMLAILYVDENSLRVLPAGDKNFSVNTPPFTQFLVERVLVKMQERDSELVRTGQLPPDRIFSYNIIREGDIIREVHVKNVDADRLRELKSSIRWTFEKMYDKMKTQS
jgi:hypothetical protein